MVAAAGQDEVRRDETSLRRRARQAVWAFGKLRQHTTEAWIQFLKEQGLYDEDEGETWPR